MGKLITTIELQSIYSISRSTIDRWKNDGLPYIKVGRGVRFDEELVKLWIEQNKQHQK